MIRFLGLAMIGTGVALKGAIYGYRWYHKTFIRTISTKYMGPFEENMNYEEARLILELEGTVDNKTVEECYKRVMKANHPDLGGSPYIAMKINEAREFLTK